MKRQTDPKSSPRPASPPSSATKTISSFWTSRWAVLLAVAVIILTTLAAYRDSYTGPFIFDGDGAILKNPTIRNLWHSCFPLNNGGPTTGRPVANFSLGLNYAFDGLAVRGYHALSLAIHILAGLTLFGLMRRTLLLPSLNARFGPVALPLALAVALLWVLHPMQTSAVTYVAQRSESLMGLFYMLTSYCFVRGTQSARPRLWQGSAILACLLGMGSKEVMVSAPLMVLFFDRTFVAGTFRAAWQQRRGVYLGLFATWALLLVLVIRAGSRSGGVAVSTDVSWWSYLLTQAWVIVRYLRLSLWPDPLIFDYGRAVLVNGLMEVVPFALVILLLLGGTAFSLRRRGALGFFGLCFFAILSPTSSVIPMPTELMVEHRMYLALATVIAPVVLGIYVWAGRASFVFFAVAALVFIGLTDRRNQDYRTDEAIWSDTVEKLPASARGHFNLGCVLSAQGRLDEAIAHFQISLELGPTVSEAWNNLGIALYRKGQVDEAIRYYVRAIELQPNNSEAHSNLGDALIVKRRWAEAVVQLEAGVEYEPDNVAIRNNLAWTLATCAEASVRNGPRAVELALKTDQLSDHNNPSYLATLAAAYAEAGRFPEAIASGKRALELATSPAMADVLRNHLALYQAGRPFHEPAR